MKILLASLLKRRLGSDVTASRPHMIYEMAQGLARNGHEVSILATGDSVVPGVKIIPIIQKEFIGMTSFENPFYAETSYLVKLASKISKIGNDFDVIHNHTYPEFINLLVESKINTSMVTTIHAQATEELDSVLADFSSSHFVSISNAHKNGFHKTNIEKVIYNGIDTDFYTSCDKKNDYMLWLGRLSKAKNKDGSFMDPKGAIWAIKLAEKSGERLVMYGNVEDMDFYNKEVKPHLGKNISWHGPVDKEQKLRKEDVRELMQKAKAFLMTINWNEPFGLVMAEAMACGTPVIGFDRGSVGELVVNAKTGFVVSPEKGTDGLLEALKNINSIKAEDCRRHVEENFSLSKMISNYEALYKEVINKN